METSNINVINKNKFGAHKQKKLACLPDSNSSTTLCSYLYLETFDWLVLTELADVDLHVGGTRGEALLRLPVNV